MLDYRLPPEPLPIKGAARGGSARGGRLFRSFALSFALLLVVLATSIILNYFPTLKSYKELTAPVLASATFILVVVATYLQLRVFSSIPPLLGIGLDTKKLARQITPGMNHKLGWWDWRCEDLYNETRSAGATHQYALECCYIAERGTVSHSEFRERAALMYEKSASPTLYALARKQGLEADVALLVATGELEMDLALVL